MKYELISDWQTELARSITDLSELLSRLQLSSDELPQLDTGKSHFSLRVTESYLQRIQPENPQDPLLLQILPTQQENLILPGYSQDPVGDLDASNIPGIIHKYTGRVLIIATGACGIHCRYCFRRHYPYQEFQFTPSRWSAMLDYIASRETVHEVILSGGDPFSLSDQRLFRILDDLDGLPNIKRVRFHTRMPVILPARVTPELVTYLAESRIQFVVVIHSNHAQELNDEVGKVLKVMSSADITLLNQSVLLKGINDDVSSLIHLSEQLIKYSVLPYYLHQLDPVQGAHHFQVEDKRAKELIKKLSSSLSGYLVPRLVKEIATKPAKVLLK